MIAMPIFPNEEEYLDRIKELVHNNDYTEIEKTLNGINGLRDILYKNSAKGNEPLFDKLILAPFDILTEIYNLVKDKHKKIFKETITTKGGKKKEVLKKEWEKLNNLYKTFVKNGNNTWLIDKYGIKCCPYCNENFVFNRKMNSGKVKAIAELDHFYPKSEFPIFALCLYNLVPVCTSCNHIKSSRELKISPHDHSRNFSELRITYEPISVDHINNFDEIELCFKYDDPKSEFAQEMESDLELLGIKEAYNEHKDYVQEILRKIVIYNKEYRDSLLSEFNNLFASDEELLRTIFGNYIEEKDLLKRPLSKMTQDILKDSNQVIMRP